MNENSLENFCETGGCANQYFATGPREAKTANVPSRTKKSTLLFPYF